MPQPADSYSLAVNCDLHGFRGLARRPLAYSGLEAHTLLHVSAIETEYFGVQHLRIRRRAGGVFADTREAGEDGHPRTGLLIRFLDTPGGAQADYVAEGGSTWRVQHAFAVQIGEMLFLSFAFTGGVSVTYAGNLKDYQTGAKDRYLVVHRQAASRTFPFCRAGVYAFGRVWLAACQPGEPMRHLFVAVSDRADGDALQPRLWGPLIPVGFAGSGDVLGLCPLGSEMLVFKRGGVGEQRDVAGGVVRAGRGLQRDQHGLRRGRRRGVAGVLAGGVPAGGARGVGRGEAVQGGLGGVAAGRVERRGRGARAVAPEGGLWGWVRTHA